VQAALARGRLGEYQAQAAIAALHADAASVEDTDWVQIVEWYDELLQFADTPVVRLNRAVAVGEADGALAGLAALARSTSTSRGAMRSPRISTRRTEILNSRPASMPTPPTSRPTSLSAITRCAKLPDSTKCCTTTDDRGGRTGTASDPALAGTGVRSGGLATRFCSVAVSPGCTREDHPRAESTASVRLTRNRRDEFAQLADRVGQRHMVVVVA
jgi:hypothetical protein